MPQPPLSARLVPRTGSREGGLLSTLSPAHTTLLTLTAAAAAAAVTDPAALGLSPIVVVPLAVTGGSARETTLENDTRASVYDRVRDHPGSSIAEVAEAVGVSHSTATYHLDTLENAGLVVSIEDGNKRRFFANAGAYGDRERRTLAVLENETTRQLLTVLARREPMYRSHLAEALGVAPPTINWHLDRLEDLDAVQEDPDGRLVVDDTLGDVLDSLTTKLDEVPRDSDGVADLAEVVAR